MQQIVQASRFHITAFTHVGVRSGRWCMGLEEKPKGDKTKGGLRCGIVI